MHLKRKQKPKPMSEETAKKGAEFISALGAEGHDYTSAKIHFLCLLTRDAMEKSGNVAVEAAGKLGVSRNRFRELRQLAGLPVKKMVPV